MLTHFSSVVNYFIIYTQSENSFNNHIKGIFIRLLPFKTADDFCLQMSNKAKIRLLPSETSPTKESLIPVYYFSNDYFLLMMFLVIIYIINKKSKIYIQSNRINQ